MASRSGASKPMTPVQNTLRLPADKLVALLDVLDRDEHGGRGKPKRTHTRARYRAVGLPVVFRQPGFVSPPMYLACRNLSANGIGLLHSAYVHPGTRCAVKLPKHDGRPVSLTGVVVRCGHVSGVLHDLGVRFDQPIVPADFLRIDPMSGWYSRELVEADAVKGRVGFVSRAPAAVRAFRAAIAETAVELIPLPDPAAVLAADPAQLDAVVIAAAAEEGAGGFETLERLTEAGFDKPVVLTGDPQDPDTLTTGRHPLVTVFCPVPFRPEIAARALADVLEIGRARAAAELFSGRGTPAEQLALAAKKLRGLMLRGAAAEDIAAACRAVMTAAIDAEDLELGQAARAAADAAVEPGRNAARVAAELLGRCAA